MTTLVMEDHILPGLMQCNTRIIKAALVASRQSLVPIHLQIWNPIPREHILKSVTE